MKNKLIAALFTITLSLSTSVFSASLPAGTYQKTCQQCKMNGGTLSCLCKNPNNKFAGKSYLAFSLACKNIENVNGLLSCKGGYDYQATPGNPAKSKTLWTMKNAGPIYSNQQAKKICSKTCLNKNNWSGHWKTMGSTSYCQCKSN